MHVSHYRSHRWWHSGWPIGHFAGFIYRTFTSTVLCHLRPADAGIGKSVYARSFYVATMPKPLNLKFCHGGLLSSNVMLLSKGSIKLNIFHALYSLGLPVSAQTKAILGDAYVDSYATIDYNLDFWCLGVLLLLFIPIKLSAPLYRATYPTRTRKDRCVNNQSCPVLYCKRFKLRP